MHRFSSRPLLLVIAAVALLALGAAAWFYARPGSRASAVEFTIPPGTFERQQAGEPVAVLPETIRLKHGQQNAILIRNNDAHEATIGPFKIAPGQSITMPYPNRGTFDLVCTLHASQRLRVIVE